MLRALPRMVVPAGLVYSGVRGLRGDKMTVAREGLKRAGLVAAGALGECDCGVCVCVMACGQGSEMLHGSRAFLVPPMYVAGGAYAGYELGRDAFRRYLEKVEEGRYRNGGGGERGMDWDKGGEDAAQRREEEEAATKKRKEEEKRQRFSEEDAARRQRMFEAAQRMMEAREAAQRREDEEAAAKKRKEEEQRHRFWEKDAEADQRRMEEADSRRREEEKRLKGLGINIGETYHV